MSPVGRGLLTTVLCLLLLLGSVAAQAEAAPSADVLVGVFPHGADMESYRSVMASAVSYKLSGLGLSVAFLPVDARDTDLEARARRDGLPVTLGCRYDVAGGKMSVSLSWHEVGGAGSPVERTESGSLDLRADAIIFRALDSLLLAVKGDVDRLASARAAASRAAQTPPPAQSPRAPIVPASKPPAGTARVATTPPRAGGLAVTAGFAPFIAIGPASSYFSVGLLPSILASMQFSTPAGSFSVGVYTAMVIFTATGLIDTASSYLIPVGPDLRYEAGNGRPILVFAHLCGGPAFLLMNTGAQGTLFDITEFLKSGLGATFMISPRVGLSVAADYEIYFEMPYLIMGFSPTAMVSVLL